MPVGRLARQEDGAGHRVQEVGCDTPGNDPFQTTLIRRHEREQAFRVGRNLREDDVLGASFDDARLDRSLRLDRAANSLDELLRFPL